MDVAVRYLQRQYDDFLKIDYGSFSSAMTRLLEDIKMCGASVDVDY